MNSSPDVLRESFRQLNGFAKQAVSGMLPGVTAARETHLCEEHAFDNMQTFSLSLRRSVLQLFIELSDHQQQNVYTHVLVLAQTEEDMQDENFEDPAWGEAHAEDNILRLIDALSMVLDTSDDRNRGTRRKALQDEDCL
jgi:hypothetical protein